VPDPGIAEEIVGAANADTLPEAMPTPVVVR
jgi:hypothetical protein